MNRLLPPEFVKGICITQELSSEFEESLRTFVILMVTNRTLNNYHCLQTSCRTLNISFSCFQAFDILPQSLRLSEYDPPENAAANLWLMCNSSILGFTDLYEACRVQAGTQGLLEYYLQEYLPAVSKQEKLIKETVS